ncbi:restriction endonuclease subunit S [Blautia sp.]|jgi:type I restriction enzyme S subunit|uniref:restriction endonuclease subunit S n=1 Tax=Blautia sp. TaxID=1955243 RepID=UPI003D94F08A
MTAQQLKNSILQMAVQGKLVPQDPNDEPASVLLERIRAEKEQLIKEKKIKKEKNPSVIFRGADNLPYEKVGKNEPVCIADQIPFEIPDSWEWVRIKNLGAIIRGSGIKRNETVESGSPCVRYGEIYTTYNTSFTSTVSFIPEEINEKCKHFSYGDILMTLTGENKPDIAKAVAYLGEEPVAAGGDLAFWTAHGMNPLYLAYLLASPYVISRKVELATGDIIVHISGDKIGSILIPIPPLNEQMRIVEKIQETECQIRQYSEKEQELTILHRAFPEALKKSILLQAVQGKLVEQDPTDEPAEFLLERIRAEKQRLVKEGKIKKDKHESIIFRRDNSHYEKLDGVERCIDDELPFEIPETWEWIRLGTLFQHNTGKALNASNKNGQKLTYITTSNLYWDRFVLDSLKEMFFTDSEIEKCTVQQGDLLVCEGGDIGRAAIWNYDISMRIQNHIHRLRAYMPVCTRFFYYLFYLYKGAGWIGGKGIAIQGLSSNAIHNLLFPLPPLKEQFRIVEMIDNTLQIVSAL